MCSETLEGIQRNGACVGLIFVDNINYSVVILYEVSSFPIDLKTSAIEDLQRLWIVLLMTM